MADIDWNRVYALNRTITSVGTGNSPTGADKEGIARANAARQELNNILSGGSAGSSWRSDINTGAEKLNSAISTAQSGVGIAGAGAGAMRGDAASMRQQANLVNTQGNAVNQSADALAALVPKLDPYAAKLGNYGDDLNALAQSLTSQTKDAFGQAGMLVNLDPNATGMAAEYMRQYGLMDPTNYVSRAASDVQASFENVAGQQERALARRGVNAGSGANVGAMEQLRRALAVAQSAAKTNAYTKGLEDQRGYLSTMTNAAKTFYDMGAESSQQALAAKNAAGDMQKDAAGIVTTQGGLLKDAGALRSQAGTLFANAANIFGGAAGIEGDAANLELSAMKSLQAAYQSAADYYLQVGNQGLRGSGGGGGGTRTVESPSSKPEQTGAWVDLTHGKASHADGAQWVWDSNAAVG